MRDRGDHCHCVVYGIDFSWFAAGLSALLTWLMNVPGPRRDRFTESSSTSQRSPFRRRVRAARDELAAAR